MAGKPKNKEPLYILPNGVEVWNEFRPTKTFPYWRVSVKPHPIFEATHRGKFLSLSRNRVVMAAHLGRSLDRWELVHHKNENKEDDHFDNLEILSPKEHSALHLTGKPIPQKTRDKMSLGVKRAYAEGRIAVSPDFFRKLNLGRHPSMESRKKMSISAKAAIAEGRRKLPRNKYQKRIDQNGHPNF